MKSPNFRPQYVERIVVCAWTLLILSAVLFAWPN